MKKTPPLDGAAPAFIHPSSFSLHPFRPALDRERASLYRGQHPTPTSFTERVTRPRKTTMAAADDLKPETQTPPSPSTAVTAEGVRWVNHSWFYDLVVYLIYGAGESAGVVLIVLKALAVTALAGVMLVLSRNSGQRWLIAGVCTAVAMLAAGPRLLFQPVVL